MLLPSPDLERVDSLLDHAEKTAQGDPESPVPDPLPFWPRILQQAISAQPTGSSCSHPEDASHQRACPVAGALDISD